MYYSIHEIVGMVCRTKYIPKYQGSGQKHFFFALKITSKQIYNIQPFEWVQRQFSQQILLEC